MNVCMCVRVSVAHVWMYELEYNWLCVCTNICTYVRVQALSYKRNLISHLISYNITHYIALYYIEWNNITQYHIISNHITHTHTLTRAQTQTLINTERPFTPGSEGISGISQKGEVTEYNPVARGALYALSACVEGQELVERESHSVQKVAIIDLDIHHGKN